MCIRDSLEIDTSGLLDGVAMAQTSSASLAASQGYGMNLTGINIGSANGAFEEDDVAEFTTTSTGFSGLIDINDQGSLSFDQTFSGSYTPDSPATGRGVLTSNDMNGVYYAVNSSTALFLETDSTQIGTGTLQVQTAGAQASGGVRMTVPRVTAVGHRLVPRK